MSAQAPARPDLAVVEDDGRPADDRPARPDPDRRPRPAPASPIVRARVSVAIGLALVLGVFAARCWAVARADAITSDEITHLVHCLHYWATGDDLVMWELGAPRLPHALNALPAYLALRPLGLLARTDPASVESLVVSGNNRVLLPARAVAVAWGMALILAVFWAAARTRGAAAGLVAAAVVSMVPEVLAHSAIAGSDIPFTTSAFLALVLLARYAEAPGAGRWLAASLAVGLAWSMRHTALVLLPTAGFVHLVANARRERPATISAIAERCLGSAVAGLGLAAIAFGVLWAGDGLGTETLAGISGRVTTLSVPDHVGPIDVSSVPIPTSVLSILKQVRHQNLGHEAYYLGAIGRTGWATYFPVAFLLKTPVGLIALIVLAAALARPRSAWDVLAVGFLALLWVMLVRNRVNIGVRYAILTYPLAAPFVADLFRRRVLLDRLWGPITLAATAWFVGASLLIPGRYLSYFNEIGGGPSCGWLYLADSNVDWGQDFNALAPALDRLGIDDVTVDVTTERRLIREGHLAVVNPAKSGQIPAITAPNRRLYDSEGSYIPVHTRHVAASVSRLLGLYSQNDVSWLRTRRVVGRVGDSIFLFDMDTPADRPFFDPGGTDPSASAR